MGACVTVCARFVVYVRVLVCMRVMSLCVLQVRPLPPSMTSPNPPPPPPFLTLLSLPKPDGRTSWRLGPDASFHRLASMALTPGRQQVSNALDVALAHHATLHPPSPPNHSQLLAGAKPDERARWRLGPDASSHRLTSMAGCLSLPGVDGALDLAVTRHAMRAVGLDCTDQEQLFSILAALLHLGDVDFNPCPSGGEGCGVGEKSEASLAAAASLLGCDAGALRKAVTTRTRVTPDGPIVSPLGLKAAGETRDAMAKVVYARLFDWLVARVNNAIGEDEVRGRGGEGDVWVLGAPLTSWVWVVWCSVLKGLLQPGAWASRL